MRRLGRTLVTLYFIALPGLALFVGLPMVKEGNAFGWLLLGPFAIVLAVIIVTGCYELVNADGEEYY